MSCEGVGSIREGAGKSIANSDAPPQLELHEYSKYVNLQSRLDEVRSKIIARRSEHHHVGS